MCWGAKAVFGLKTLCVIEDEGFDSMNLSLHESRWSKLNVLVFVHHCAKVSLYSSHHLHIVLTVGPSIGLINYDTRKSDGSTKIINCSWQSSWQGCVSCFYLAITLLPQGECFIIFTTIETAAGKKTKRGLSLIQGKDRQPLCGMRLVQPQLS